MEIGILIATAAGVIILFLYVLAKMDDRLVQANNRVKGANFTIENLQREVAELKERVKFYTREAQKANHRADAMKVDYDRLLTDYHVLEQENAK